MQSHINRSLRLHISRFWPCFHFAGDLESYDHIFSRSKPGMNLNSNAPWNTGRSASHRPSSADSELENKRTRGTPEFEVRGPYRYKSCLFVCFKFEKIQWQSKTARERFQVFLDCFFCCGLESSDVLVTSSIPFLYTLYLCSLLSRQILPQDVMCTCKYLLLPFRWQIA